MKHRDDIMTGKFQFATMDALILNNENKEKILGVRIKWGVDGTKIYGKIFRGDVMIYEQYYESGYFHKRYAMMHLDIAKFLGKMEQNWLPMRKVLL